MDVHRRLRWVAGIVATGFLVALLLTRKLWLSTRLFPLTPVSGYLPDLPPPIDYLVFAALVGLAVAIVVARNPRVPLIAVTVLYLAYGLWDQQRWTPFFPEIAALFAILSVNHWRLRESERARDVLDTCGVVLAFAYFWSGLHKLNHAFYADVFPRLATPFAPWIPDALEPHLVYVAALLPLLQVFTGVALMTRRLRSAGIAFGVVTHVVVLIAVGFPLLQGETYSTEVWFWNFVRIALLLLVFRGNDTSFVDLFTVPLTMHKLAVIVFGIMPIFNLFSLPRVGRWDDLQAAGLYAGNGSRATVHLPPAESRKVPYPLRRLLTAEPATGHLVLRVDEWAHRDLMAPLHDARRIQRNAARALCRYMIDPQDVFVRLESRADPITGERSHVDVACERL